MTTLTDRLLELLAARKAAHARWYVSGEDTKKNRAECKALGEADDALELFVHAECYDIADEITRLTSDMETLMDSLNKAEGEITTLRETLAWYGNGANDDRGQRARDALQKGGRDG